MTATASGLQVQRQLLANLSSAIWWRARGQPVTATYRLATVLAEHQSPGPPDHRDGRNRRQALPYRSRGGFCRHRPRGDVGAPPRGARGHREARTTSRRPSDTATAASQGSRTYRDPVMESSSHRCCEGRALLKNEVSPLGSAAVISYRRNEHTTRNEQDGPTGLDRMLSCSRDLLPPRRDPRAVWLWA